MKKLLILLTLSCSVAVGQTVKVVYPGYISYWNKQTKIPDSVVYIASPHKKVVGREAGFHADGTAPNFDKDYAHSGFDIGHMCNASDENGNKIDEYNSFSYVNVFPQRPNCNRLTWLALENYVRALNKPVRVKVYWSGIAGHIGKDAVTVPLYCLKTITYSGHTETYKIPNQDSCTRHAFTYYKIK